MSNLKQSRPTISQRLKSAIAAFRFMPQSLESLDAIEETGWVTLGGRGSTFNDLQLLKDRTEIPEVGAIVTLKSRAFSKMIVRQVSKETGQDMKNQQNLIKVLRNPNWFQSWKEFMMQTKDFRETFGEEMLFLDYPFGMPSRRAKAMYTLPPYHVEVKTPDKRPFFLQADPEIEYKFIWENSKYEVAKEQLVHITSNRVDMSPDNWVRGESWISYNKPCVNNIRSAYRARGIMIDNIGVQGILSNAGKDPAGVLPMDEKEKEELRKRLNQLGKQKGKFPAIITGLALDWKEMGVKSVNDLGLFDETQKDFERLCDSAGVHPILFGGNDSTFENQKWAERRMYENTIIPEAEEWIGALNSQFETENESWMIVGDFSHLNVFQENLKERGAAMKMIADGLTQMLNSQAINVEEYRDELRRLGIVIPKA